MAIGYNESRDGQEELQRGDSFEYTITTRFGKRITERVKVVGVFGAFSLLDNGDEVSTFKRWIPGFKNFKKGR